MNTKIVDVISNVELMKHKVKQKSRVTAEGYDLSLLNAKELKYFKMIYPTSGVPILYSEPALAKTRILRSIAEKLNWRYIDIRLSMRDETDVGLYPDKIEMPVTYMVDGKEEVRMEKFLDHIVPLWAYRSNQGPCLIHFEELNRAPLAVRNAALQILLEREIGDHFKFNDNVYMVATGNLGEEDGTDVEEFDSALNSRLIHVRHTLTLDDWFEGYAYEHIHESIIKYLTAHPDHYYIMKKERSDKGKAYACPREWTFLSDYITKNYGKNAPIEEWIYDIANIGTCYIGSVNTSFMRYLDDALKLGIMDIVDKYPILKKEGIKLNRDKKSELLTELRTMDISKFTEVQIENIKQFLLDMGEDEVTAFLIKVLDEDYKYVDDKDIDEQNNGFVLGFFRDKRFHKYEQVMLEYVQKSNRARKGATEEEIVDGTAQQAPVSTPPAPIPSFSDFGEPEIIPTDTSISDESFWEDF